MNPLIVLVLLLSHTNAQHPFPYIIINTEQACNTTELEQTFTEKYNQLNTKLDQLINAPQESIALLYVFTSLPAFLSIVFLVYYIYSKLCTGIQCCSTNQN